MRQRSFIPLFLYDIMGSYQKGPRSKGVMRMTTRERILMIRLMQKIEKHPKYAMLLGIEATGVVRNQNRKSNNTGLAGA